MVKARIGKTGAHPREIEVERVGVRAAYDQEVALVAQLCDRDGARTLDPGGVRKHAGPARTPRVREIPEDDARARTLLETHDDELADRLDPAGMVEAGV